ncbi:hypothetical protein PUNSTDRAFT_134099 [Punctularia strigosozonata HHB-11173 SS5]|uniref:uncharacterized protein n=1 Tax=Punctularia strigosozonata (strain HHB-11173) TaxID=741275 RepID=UPI0004417646|nr:uncharacterized protein PUNSTDRAFT_134099 [Punctularia strigosozonata HHB-11173 SS5]EIN08925.1 hypothetical protein PUNSTDRAFT_134099 [Punctularia strigosozonata HHB-11173 SS5]
MADPLEEEVIALKEAARIPLYVSVVSLTWVLHDYVITLKDEVRYMWASLSSIPWIAPGKWNFGKFIFFWVRYYTIALALFDIAQIHSFATFRPSLNTCVVMDAMIRVVGALSLWAIEIVMQLRVFAIFRCSKRVAVVNAVLFAASVAGFLYILIHNALGRAAVIKTAKALPIPGCPVVHTGIEWAQWVPATLYEGILFGFAIYKTLAKFMQALRSRAAKRTHTSKTLYHQMLQDNLLYFFGIACILVFNNLMVTHVTHIPWFSYGPFHAVTGIVTGRMLIHLRKALEVGPPASRMTVSQSLAFSPGARSITAMSLDEEDELDAYPSPQIPLSPTRGSESKSSSFGHFDAGADPLSFGA